MARFIELLEQYGEVQDRLSAIAPDVGEIEVLVWPDCGDWVLDKAWERRWWRTLRVRRRPLRPRARGPCQRVQSNPPCPPNVVELRKRTELGGTSGVVPPATRGPQLDQGN